MTKPRGNNVSVRGEQPIDPRMEPDSEPVSFVEEVLIPPRRPPAEASLPPRSRALSQPGRHTDRPPAPGVNHDSDSRRRLAQLHAEVASASETIAQLHAELEALRQRAEHAAIARVEAESRAAAAERRAESVSSQGSSTTVKLAEAEQSLEKATDRSRAQDGEIEALQLCLRSSDRERDALKQERDALKQEHETLQQAHSALEKQRDTLRQEQEDYKALLEESFKDKDDAVARLDAQREAEVTALQLRLSEAESRAPASPAESDRSLGELQAEVVRLRAERAASERADAERTSEITRLKAEIEQLKAEAQQPRASAEGDLSTQLKADNERLKAEADKLKAEVEQARAEVSQLKVDADKLKADADKLREETDRLNEQARADADRLKAEVEQARAEVNQLKADADKLKAEADRQAGEHRAEIERLAGERQAEIERLAGEHRAEIERLTAAHASALQGLTSEQARERESQKLEQAASLLEAQAQIRLEFSSLEEQLKSEQAAREASYQADKEALTARVGQAEAERDAARKEADKLKGDLLFEQEMRSKSRAAYESAMARTRGDLERSLAERDDELSQAKARAADAVAARALAENEARAQRAAADELRARVARLEGSVQSAESATLAAAEEVARQRELRVQIEAKLTDTSSKLEESLAQQRAWAAKARASLEALVAALPPHAG